MDTGTRGRPSSSVFPVRPLVESSEIWARTGARRARTGETHRSGRLAAAAVIALSSFVTPHHGAPWTPRTPASAPGRIEGVATISTRLTTPRLRVRVYDEPGTPPPKPAAEENPLANVVLYLESADGAVALRELAPQAARSTPALRQRDERFMPHVLAVQAGTAVEFPNDDAVYHNVFSLSSVKSFDLGRYPKGQSRTVTFPAPGVVQVFCHIHADMSGNILVLENPFFVVPDAQGHFALDGVPPGEYRLMAWHERIKPFSTPVRVESGRTTTLALRIPIPDRPATQ
jgi:plastocyanin